MNQQRSEELNAFIDTAQRGARPRAYDADSAFARDMMQAASEVEPDAGFVAMLGARLMEGALPGDAYAQGAVRAHSNGRLRMAARRRPQLAVTWAAVLVIGMMLGVLVFALGAPNVTRLQPAALQSATATAVPTVIENPLPILTGGYAAADATTFARMFDIGLRWAGLSLEYRAADADAILAEARTFIEAARDQRLGVLVSLWGTAAEVAAAQADDYRALADFSQRLAALGPMAIEVWPEANIDIRWPTGRIGGASYAELLRPVADAIRSTHPDIWIIAGAPAPTGAEAAFPGRVVNDDTFYRQLAQAGVAPHVDCIGVHYVEGVVEPRATTGDPRDEFATRYLVPMIQRAAAPFRDTLLPVCLTELGYMSPEGIPGPLNPAFAWANSTSVEEQATWLADALPTVAMLSSVRVALVMVYRIDGQPGDTIASAFAIIRPDGSCAACEQIASLQE